MNASLRLLTFLSLCCGPTARAEAPYLVKDINPSTSRQPRAVQKPVVAGSKAYFSAWSREAGQEIWVTDRTVAGTRVLKDIFPGMLSSEPSRLMAAGSRIYFIADDGVHGREPWTSDGTAAGTRLLGDFFPGSGSDNPQPIGATSSRVWIQSGTPTGIGLWSSDGTPEGTIELNPSVEGSGRRFGAPRIFCTVGNTAYFAVGDHSDLWRSDGTVEGTQRIEQFDSPPGVRPEIHEMKAAGDRLYFILSVAGRESVWHTDGSPDAAVQIPRSPESDTWTILRNLHVAGENKLFFIGQPEEGTEEAWRRGDGTLAGSERFLGDGPPMGNDAQIALFGDALYFAREDASAGYELWRSDGTKAGTVRLKDIDPGTRSSSPASFTVSGSWLYFMAATQKNGREIWRTDGTEKGTRLVLESARGSGSTGPEDLTADSGNLFFLGGQLSPGNDLWFVDGAKRKGRQLTTPGAKGESGAGGATPGAEGPEISAAVGGNYLFGANDGKSGGSLWSSNGTSKDTKPLIKVKPFASLTSLGTFTPFGSKSLFVAAMYGKPRQLWITNGSSGGTRQLTNLPVESAPGDIVTNGTVAFFTSGQPIYNRLWMTDGTAGGTRQLFQPDEEPFNVSPGAVHLQGSTLYFVSTTPSLTRELWRTDGTAAGTVRIKNDFPAASQQELKLGNLRQAGDKVCFTTTIPHPSQPWPARFSQLWSTDGTTVGTVPVPFDIIPATNIWIRRSLQFGEKFLFLGTLDVGGSHWWISDGTTEGTRRLTATPVLPGTEYEITWPTHETLGGKLFFMVEDATHGLEPWITDGTPEGTSLIADIRPGNASSYPSDFTPVGDRIYFTADDGVHGRELWVTDGTEAGTVMAADILPGTLGSSPFGLRVAGNRLFFSAESLHQGIELHAINLPAAAAGMRLAATSASVESSGLPSDSRELLNHAFNLAPGCSDTTSLTPGTGTSGFPAFSRADGVFRAEYLRRNDGQLRYVAKCSPTLEPGSFVPMTGPETVVDLDGLWQRVIIEHPVNDGTPRMFGIVEVEAR
jgi:ELWxxDGT repeat protein